MHEAKGKGLLCLSKVQHQSGRRQQGRPETIHPLQRLFEMEKSKQLVRCEIFYIDGHLPKKRLELFSDYQYYQVRQK